jgi:PhzF family phenazine biosynthesis protein
VRIPLHQIDAFADRQFGGNPAAVCLLATWPSDALLQNIAAENNLSETAFVVADGDAWHLRWFTPAMEVDLCGHATLATAHVLLERYARDRDDVRFRTLSGELTVRRSEHGLTMDFPALPPGPPGDAPGITAALGAPPRAVHPIRAVLGRRYCLAVFESSADVAGLAPDLRTLGRELRTNVVCTAPGDDVDFVSRFFAPASGIDEDPVTGSAHCTLAPYWADRLGRTLLRARQISRRGGDLVCEVRGERVLISGRCATYLTGEIDVEDR